MRERARLPLVPLLVAVLAGIIVVGLMTASPRPVDRAQRLAEELRCPVCQGESIADSPSATAAEIQSQIEEMVAAGRSDEEIRDYYVARYGRWVLLDPPATGDTVLVWVLPLAAAAGGVAMVLTRRRHPGRTRPLDDDERDAVQRAVAELRREEVGS